MRYFSWILTIPLTVLAVAFAVFNREAAAIDVFGSGIMVDVPLYIAVLTPFVVGFVLGGIIAYAGGSKTRRKARRLEKENNALKKVNESLADVQQQIIADNVLNKKPDLKLIENNK